MTTIYPCPFCGHEDVEIDEVAISEYAVDCPECRAIGPICIGIMGAIAAWNGATLRTPDIIKFSLEPFVAAPTPAGGGDITPAASAAPTSSVDSPGAGLATEPPPVPTSAPEERPADNPTYQQIIREVFQKVGL